MAKTYAIKEIYYTLQGEGAQLGRPAIFIRFSGCNLWSGREEDREKAICRFCDTDFWGTDGERGGRYSAEELTQIVLELWPERSKQKPYIVCTGGEPLLQLDEKLIRELHVRGFEIAIETNGTLPVPSNIDWICVSPKDKAPLRQKSGAELKLVFPQAGIDPEGLEDYKFEHFFLQPMDGPMLAENTQAAIEYCCGHPQWQLSLQVHKFLGIP